MGLVDGLGLSSGLAEFFGVPLGEGLGVTPGSGVGDAFFFFFLGEGDGDGERFGFGGAVSDASGVGLGVGFFLEATLFFFGEGSGVAFSFGEGEGVGVVFFLVVDALRFFGGGVGSKNCFSLVPRSSAPSAERTPPPKINAHTIRSAIHFA